MGTASTASTATHFAGIDVSKDTLDAALLRPGGATRAKPFANDPAGHAALLAWADRHAAGGAVHYRMEATGPYSAAIATSLHGAGRVVSAADPARVKAHAKACGQYLNSILAKIETTREGYEEAIMLDQTGMVSEASGENIFIVRDGLIATPPPGAILDGVTRRSIMEIAGDLGYQVVERPLAPSELTLAEEVFLTGTAAELVPVREVDGHVLGEPGEITHQLQQRFEDAIYGRAEQYLEWLDIVEQPSKVTT